MFYLGGSIFADQIRFLRSGSALYYAAGSNFNPPVPAAATARIDLLNGTWTLTSGANTATCPNTSDLSDYLNWTVTAGGLGITASAVIIPANAVSTTRFGNVNTGAFIKSTLRNRPSGVL